MPTIHDVARRAGVAASTVSYVANGTRRISEPTAARVRAAMDELGYRPNALARGLASRRTRMIGLMYPPPEHGLGFTELEFVTSAASACRLAGYQMILWTNEVHDLSELKSLAGAGLVDGVLVMQVRLQDDRVAMLREAGLPFTMIGRPADSTRLSYVDIDFDATVRDAINHLTDLGHTRIALVNGSPESLRAGYGPTVRVTEAFDVEMRKCNLQPVTASCAENPEAGGELLARLVKDDPKLTAIISMNDVATVGIVGAVEAIGWSIPEHFSVMSVVSSEAVARLSRRPLTTAAPPAAQLSAAAVSLLVSSIEGKPRRLKRRLLPCTLSVGSSTGRASQGRRPRPAIGPTSPLRS